MADFDYPMHLPLELLLILPRDFELSTLVSPSRLIPSYSQSQSQDFRGASGYRWINGPMMPFQTAMPLNYDLALMPSSYDPYGVDSYACFPAQPCACRYQYHQPPPPSQRVRDGPQETPAVSVPQMYHARTRSINWTGHQRDGVLQTPTAIGVPQMYLVQPGFFGLVNPGTGVFHRPYVTGNNTTGPRRRRGSRGRRRNQRQQQGVESEKVQGDPSSRRNGHSHSASGIFVPKRTVSRSTV